MKEPLEHVQRLADYLEERNEIAEDVWKIKCLVDNMQALGADKAIEELYEYISIARKREAA